MEIVTFYTIKRSNHARACDCFRVFVIQHGCSDTVLKGANNDSNLCLERKRTRIVTYALQIFVGNYGE